MNIMPLAAWLRAQAPARWLCTVFTWTLAAVMAGTAAAQLPDDPDFKLQGEYTGNALGLQVIATGDGGFDFALYAGGLPGAGWDRSPPQRSDGDAEAISQIIATRKLKKTERTSPTLGATAPTGAVVLFDGSAASLDNWQAGAKRSPEGWLIPGIATRETFRDYSLHAEFQTPFLPKATGQGRGNSGIYHQGRYETQVLDSFGLEGKNNEAGGIYEVRDPDLNMCLPPLSWQTYDVDFTAARYDVSGKKSSDARLTVRLNGVLVQSDVRVPQPTRAAPQSESNTPGPIYLQDHGNPVRFRNIWLVPRDADREAMRPRVPGFERFFAVSQGAGDAAAAQDALGGRLLISQLGCAACHATSDAGLKPRSAPDLSQVGSRVRLDHLVGFVGGPHQTKSGTTMPDLLHHLSADERAQKAAELSSWLATTGKPSDRPGDADAAGRGDKLYHSIGCVACHAPRRGDTAHDATSVPLGNLTAKYTLDSLARFLSNPHAVRASGNMPKLVGGFTEAREIACYLLGEAIIVPGGEQFTATVYHGSWDSLPDFDKLIPVKQSKSKGLDLSLAERKDNFAMRFEAYLPIEEAGQYSFYIGSDDGSRLFVDDQQVVEFDGIHPFEFRRGRKKLEAGVHRLRLEYFEKGGQEQLEFEIEGPGMGRAPAALLVSATAEAENAQPLLPSKFQPVASLAAAGSQTFQKIGCANCHTLKIGEQIFTSTLTAPPLNSLKSAAGCLADKVPAGAPDFAISPAQRRALTAALAQLSSVSVAKSPASVELTAAQRTHLTLASFNCYACHSRQQFGGPELSRDALFTTTVQEMGNEARLPPPLTGVGDKLKPDVIQRIVAEGAKDRPYMLTRMPAFSPGNAAQWATLRQELETLDAHAAYASTSAAPPRAGDEPSIKDGVENHKLEAYTIEGRKLVGGTGLACIKCHTYDKRGTPGIQAIDMLTMTERLRPDWFVRYMLAPAEYRPGTRMPLSFPEGKSVLTTVLEGNAEAQIRAMWTYLSAGKKAKPPNGLEGQTIALSPDQTPIIYRNFIEGLTPRGIAVGYPEHINLAWDAGTMNLAQVWKNEFIDASKHWVGRGPGNQGPLGDAIIKLASGLPLAKLDAVNATWPELGKTKTARELGYRFHGYTLNAKGQPAFKYSIGDMQVVDSYTPLVSAANAATGFERRIKTTSAAEDYVLRLARGAIKPAANGAVTIDGELNLTVTGATATVTEVGNAQELRVSLPKSKAHEIAIVIQW